MLSGCSFLSVDLQDRMRAMRVAVGQAAGVLPWPTPPWCALSSQVWPCLRPGSEQGPEGRDSWVVFWLGEEQALMVRAEEGSGDA